ILDGMRTLLTAWDAKVIAVSDPDAAIETIEAAGGRVTGLLVDYHLDRGNGVAAIRDIRRRFGENIPAILITADRSPHVRAAAREGIAKARSIVPHHGQAAASFWSIEREGRNDGVPPKLQAPLKSLDISSAVAVLGQKVERCPIVPNVVSPWRVPGGSVRDNPL